MTIGEKKEGGEPVGGAREKRMGRGEELVRGLEEKEGQNFGEAEGLGMVWEEEKRIWERHAK